MKQTAVVIAPGRGTYNAGELGYLARHHAERGDLIDAFDAQRRLAGQDSLRSLDGADRYRAALHTRGDHASALIYASGYCDYLAIDRNRFDIVAVTGNSMGWYTALACAGALSATDGFHVSNTMGRLMQDAMIGGQLIYPFVGADWRPVPGLRDTIDAKVADINARAGHCLGLSIALGGMVVLAGDDAGLAAFTAEMPVVQDRFPMRLSNHAAFHTDLQMPVAAQGQAALPAALLTQPGTALIDGRGAIWRPNATLTQGLWGYTLGHQVTQTYDFTTAIRVAAREFMPDVFIILGPGTTLGGAVGQSLVAAQWRGATDKAAFQALTPRRLMNMGDPEQRGLVC